MKKVAVIGAGYVGLVTGTCLAQKNNLVVIVERDIEKITALLNGKVPFYEPGLDKLIVNGIKNNALLFVNSIEQALVHEPEIIFSCVGTPSLPNGSADLSAVWQVAHEIGTHMQHNALIVTKSTVPVGTARRVHSIIADKLNERGIDINFEVASNPEFLKEGDAVNDFLNPDRIVIGVESSYATTLLSDLYLPFTHYHNVIVTMTLESAELTKYAANAMLASRISFINQIALLADTVGANIDEVKKGIALDKRIGGFFLNPGIGYGGSCFPKDVQALVHMGQEHQVPMTLAQEIEAINNHQRAHFAEQILSFYNHALEGKRIGIWGLAFKPETDDIRHAPSLDIIDTLLKYGAKITAYDPVANNNIRTIFKTNITLVKNADDVIKNSDSLVILTEWKEFLEYDFERFTILKDNVIFDGRNCYNPERITQLGITYISLGRALISKPIRPAFEDFILSPNTPQSSPSAS